MAGPAWIQDFIAPFLLFVVSGVLRLFHNQWQDRKKAKQDKIDADMKAIETIRLAAQAAEGERKRLEAVLQGVLDERRREMDNRLRQFEQQASEHLEELREATRNQARMQAQIEDLTGRLQEKEEEVGRLRARVKELEAEVKQLREQRG